MSKYIDAELYVEMQIYDDEHEDWGIWNGTIEELLDQWTEQGCPSAIEVSDGWWENYKDEHRCSECGEVVIGDWNDLEWYDYCPNCGAKMKG